MLFDEELEVDVAANIVAADMEKERKKYGLLNGDPAITRLEPRLELQHRIWQLSLPDCLTLTPVPTPESGKLKDAMDIGCGTGAWVLDLAAAYPSARVTGVDMKPLQPSSHPANVHFVVDDFMKPSSTERCPYDLVHSRSISSGISDWPALVQKCWECLRPGGWIELQEFHLPMRCDDDTMAGTAFERWNHSMVEASAKIGVKVDGGFAEVPNLLEEMGFAEIHRKGIKWAVGPWPKDPTAKEIGRMFRADLSIVLEGISLRYFPKVLGWKPEAVSELWTEVEAEMAQCKMHAYVPMEIVWAQKPRSGVE